MAGSSGMNSTVGIIAIIILVGLAVYFVMNRADDDELEIDIGSREAPVDVRTAPQGVVAPAVILA